MHERGVFAPNMFHQLSSNITYWHKKEVVRPTFQHAHKQTIKGTHDKSTPNLSGNLHGHLYYIGVTNVEKPNTDLACTSVYIIVSTHGQRENGIMVLRCLLYSAAAHLKALHLDKLNHFWYTCISSLLHNTKEFWLPTHERAAFWPSRKEVRIQYISLQLFC